MGGKRATDQQIDNFRVDARSLRRKYQNIEMADKMKEDPSWLSGCISGSKRPGKGLIDTFYMVFGQELIDNSTQKETGRLLPIQKIIATKFNALGKPISCSHKGISFLPKISGTLGSMSDSLAL